MLLAIDVGNTRVKFGIFENETVVEVLVCNSKDCLYFLKEIWTKYAIENTILSSVARLEDATINFLKNNSNFFSVAQFDTFPFINLYTTPQTLGIDRKVLVSGATLLHPKSNVLVIDAGTCITYDLVTKENKYLGGAISPGLTLRYKSLHAYTANLPLLEKQIPDTIIGNSTENAIHSGVSLGVVMEINSVIERYRSEFKDLTIILTGGDAVFLAKSIKNTIFANSNFLLESLNGLFTYIKNND